MTARRKVLGSLVLFGLTMFLVACTSNDPTATVRPGQPTIDVSAQATLEALALPLVAGTSTPVAVSAEAKLAVTRFADARVAIERDWDLLHSDMDAWRNGLIVCETSSAQAGLRGFVAQLFEITQVSLALPRFPIVREQADKLISAAELEEGAVRRLKDSWQPDDPSVFLEIDSVRSASLAVQTEVQDGVTDLQQRTSSPSRQVVLAYSLAFQQIASDWDAFHQSYEDLRGDQTTLSSVDVAGRLNDLVDEFTIVTDAILDLSPSPLTRSIDDILAQASSEEDLALRLLRGTFQRTDGGGPDDEPTFQVVDPSLFDDLDEQLVATNSLRREALLVLSDVLDETSEANEAAVAVFSEQHDLLIEVWGQFHSDYDEWTLTEAGCDRQAAVLTLGDFLVQFGALTVAVGQLPGAIVLRPLGELYVEAAEREERALKALRTSWRPFDANVYEALDLERSTAGKLRRQVAAGLQDLLETYEVGASDLDR